MASFWFGARPWLIGINLLHKQVTDDQDPYTRRAPAMAQVSFQPPDTGMSSGVLKGTDHGMLDRVRVA